MLEKPVENFIMLILKLALKSILTCRRADKKNSLPESKTNRSHDKDDSDHRNRQNQNRSQTNCPNRPGLTVAI